MHLITPFGLDPNHSSILYCIATNLKSTHISLKCKGNTDAIYSAAFQILQNYASPG